MRWPLLLHSLLGAVALMAQWPVPFIDEEGRFVVFANGRFERLEQERPLRFEASGDWVVYTDAEARLKVFLPEGRRLHLLHGGPVDRWQASGGFAAWTCGDTLYVLRDGRSVPLAHPVDRFDVTDSMVVFSDLAAGELRAFWHGELFTVASITGISERVQWRSAGNTVTYHDRSARRSMQFQAGRLQVLAEGMDTGFIVAGNDVTGYWDDRSGRFMLRAGAMDHSVSDMRPVSAKAGDGTLAFVDGIGRLRCWMGGRLHTVLDEPPTEYWVQDSLLLFLDNGRLVSFGSAGQAIVSDHVPEKWAVHGGRLVYLDIDRRLWSLEGGRRKRVGSEAAIPTFELIGDAVLYRAPSGPWTVVRRGRVYLY
jgi:hypothetical protein